MAGRSACSARQSGLARMIDDGVELILEMSARNRDAACGDASLLILVADPQRMLKDPLHAGREAAFPMIPDQRATPAKQMRGFGKPTSGLNRVDRGVGRRRCP